MKVKDLGAAQRKTTELEHRCQELEELLAEKEEEIRELRSELNAKTLEQKINFIESPSWKSSPSLEEDEEEDGYAPEGELPSTSVAVEVTPLHNKNNSRVSPTPEAPSSSSPQNKAKRKKSTATPSITFMALEDIGTPPSPVKQMPTNYRAIYADELGLCSYSKAHILQPFSALYVWKRTIGNLESPANRKYDNEKFPTYFGKVWRDRERCKLYTKSKYFIVVYKVNNSYIAVFNS